MKNAHNKQEFSSVWFIILSFLTVVSITKPIIASTGINNYFYYYHNEKIRLEPSKEMVAICFSENVTDEQKEDLVILDPSLKEISPQSLMFGLELVNLNQANDVNIPEITERQNFLQEVNYCVPVLVNKGHKMILTDRFEVMFNEDINEEYIEALNKENNLEITYKCPYIPNRYRFRVLNPKDKNAMEMANIYHDNPNVIYATPCFLVDKIFQSTTPDDDLYSEQWHLNNIGQDPPDGIPDADIDAPEGWDISTGSEDIVIAIIDSGVDFEHDDLYNKLWWNPNEEWNDEDDDDNGYIDDMIGWDFYDNDNAPFPQYGTNLNYHGTAVAGLAAAETDNDDGIAGVSWDCKIMVLSLGSGGYYYEANLADAINYASNNGADVINLSLFASQNESIEGAIYYATTRGRDLKGCVIVCASGSSDHPELGVNFPACRDDVIAVGATDSSDTWCSYSHYGAELNVAAPGGDEDIVTTDITGTEGKNSGDYMVDFDGTSAAAPQVAGLAALILSMDDSLTYDEVKELIEATTDDVGDFGWDQLTGWGRINVRRALGAVDTFFNNNLEGWWKFNEGEESIAYDSAGYNDGELYWATWTTEGKFDDALYFPQGVLLDNIVSLGSNETTISAWVKAYPDYEEEYLPIVTQYYGDESNCYGYYLCLDYGVPTFFLNDDGVAAMWGPIVPEEWCHIAGTYDGSYLKIYVDGEPEGSYYVPGQIGIKKSAWIGCESYQGNSFQGIIDDVRVYNYALSDTEIEDLASE